MCTAQYFAFKLVHTDDSGVTSTHVRRNTSLYSLIAELLCTKRASGAPYMNIEKKKHEAVKII